MIWVHPNLPHRCSRITFFALPELNQRKRLWYFSQSFGDNLLGRLYFGVVFWGCSSQGGERGQSTFRERGRGTIKWRSQIPHAWWLQSGRGMRQTHSSSTMACVEKIAEPHASGRNEEIGEMLNTHPQIPEVTTSSAYQFDVVWRSSILNMWSYDDMFVWSGT